MSARRFGWFRAQFTIRRLSAALGLFAVVGTWLGVSLSGARREQEAARLVEAKGGCVVHRAAPWWNARRWVGLAFGRETWSPVDEVWVGYRNRYLENVVPPSGAWPGPLIADSFGIMFSMWTGSYGRDSESCALVLAGSDWLESFPSARRVGLVGMSDDELSHLASMHCLRDIELSDTTIIGQGLSHLADLPELRRLQLLDVPLNTTGKEQLGRLANLEELVVWDDDRFERFPDFRLDRQTADTFDDDLLARLGALRRLKTLRFCTCSPRLTVAGMTRLANIRSLRRLAIGVRPNHVPNLEGGLAHLKTLDNLQDLTLYGGGFTDSAMQYIVRLHSLVRLELYETRVTYEGLAQLRYLPSLKVVSLTGSLWSDSTNRDEAADFTKQDALSVLNALKGLDNLEDLTVDGSLITEAAVPYLREMKKLVKLKLLVKGRANLPMSDAGREQFKSALPNVIVETDSED